MQILSMGMILFGLLFLVVAAVGLIRLPDVFTRSHALGITDTMGVGLILGGIAIGQGWTENALKTVLIMGLLYHLNPVISHATLRAAIRSGLKPIGEPGQESNSERDAL